MPWTTPTGHEDPGNVYDNEPNAYDDNLDTYATVDIPPNSWCDYLILTHAPILCSGFRWWISVDRDIDRVRLSAMYDATWHDDIDTNFWSDEWRTWALMQHETLQALRIKFHNSSSNKTRQVRVHEADFAEVEAPPEPTIETHDATDIYSHRGTIHAKVNNDAGYSLSLRFNWGKTTGYGNNTAWQTGKHTEDTIQEIISGLDPNTIYHFRVEAIIE